MKIILILLIVLISLIMTAPASAQNVSTGISITDGELRSFYLSIGDYYRVPEPRVVHVKKHYRVRDEELPVVFYLASCARVEPEVVIDLRFRQRMSWLNITFHFGLTPEIYYVPVHRVGPPYGKAYGHYKKHEHDYKRVVLADEDVVNLVNLRFISDYHRVAPEMVMDMRSQGGRFVVINEEVRKGKGEHRGEDDDKLKEKHKDTGKGKGKGKGKD
jgi:major membrane immunogen (membrane-anchored lipoprotein)